VLTTRACGFTQTKSAIAVLRPVLNAVTSVLSARFITTSVVRSSSGTVAA
jgi:hypothetical protein